jgi:hypothetical protein
MDTWLTRALSDSKQESVIPQVPKPFTKLPSKKLIRPETKKVAKKPLRFKKVEKEDSDDDSAADDGISTADLIKQVRMEQAIAKVNFNAMFSAGRVKKGETSPTRPRPDSFEVDSSDQKSIEEHVFPPQVEPLPNLDVLDHQGVETVTEQNRWYFARMKQKEEAATQSIAYLQTAEYLQDMTELYRENKKGNLRLVSAYLFNMFRHKKISSEQLQSIIYQWNTLAEKGSAPTFYSTGNTITFQTKEKVIDQLIQPGLIHEIDGEFSTLNQPLPADLVEKITVTKCFSYVSLQENTEVLTYLRNQKGVGLMYQDRIYCCPITQFTHLFGTSTVQVPKGIQVKWQRDVDVVYQCRSEQVDSTQPYALIKLDTIFMIPLAHLKYMIEVFNQKKTRFFRLIPTNDSFEVTTTLSSVLTRDPELRKLAKRSVLRDLKYCQPGTGQQVYHLVPVIG